MRIVSDDKLITPDQLLTIPLHSTAAAGTWSLNQDGSSTAVLGKSNLFGSGLLTVGKPWVLTEIDINVVETGVGTNGWEASIFFGIAALTNGCLLEIYNSAGTKVADFTDAGSKPWKTAEDVGAFGEIVFPVMGVVTATTSDLIAQVHIRMPNPVYMAAGSYVQFKVQDDLTTLTELSVTASGYLL